MESIWMGIAPGRATTRVVALAGPHEPILKAQLRQDPAHPRALATLLEAIALWQGQPVRAALSADSPGFSSASTICREAFADEGNALYTLVWAPTVAHRRRRHRLEGLGSFADLERVVAEAVAR
jgi:hypothetical protein